VSIATAPNPAPAPAPLAQPSPPWRPTPVLDEAEPPLWPLTVEMYSRMVESGLLTSDDPVYLWEGRLAPLVPIHRPHSSSITKSFAALFTNLPPGCHAEQEQPLAFRHRHSVPQPDIMILRGSVEDYSKAFPTTADALLVVEVAEATLARDRKRADSYAGEEVPIYWLVNLVELRVEVYSQPEGGSYSHKATLGPGDSIPLVLDGREVVRIAVADLLP